MLVIGLTGGIGSGKSTVSDLFKCHGVPVIDMDQIARQVVAPGQAALHEIREHFGDGVFTARGELDRAALRERIFASAAQRRQLEAILHPRIREIAQQQLAPLRAPYALLVIPLLAESSQPFEVDRVLVVDVPESLQIERTMARDHLDAQQARQVLQAQAGRETRRQLADDIIRNAGTLEELQQQVDVLHESFLKLARGET